MPNSSTNPDRAALLHDDAPPAVRTNRGKVILVSASGGMIALLLLIIVLNIDREQPKPVAPPIDMNATELINPEGLSEADLRAGSLNIRKTTAIDSPEGGWIEQVDEHGRLKQQYRYSRSEALPAGMLRVDRPEVKLFLSDQRMAYLTGDSALIKAPEQSLDEGRLTGNVVIRMYKMPDTGGVDVDTDSPMLLITTHEAQFNNFQGEIHCAGRVIVQTESAYESGSKLRLRINDKLKRPEWLRIEEIEVVKLAAIPDQSLRLNPETTPREMPQTQPAKVKKPKDPSASQPAKPVKTDAERAARRAERQRIAAASQPAPEQFYRLTFDREVRIHQGDEKTGWIANGDELSVVFSMKSSGLGNSLSIQDIGDEPTRLVASHPLTFYESLAALALASFQDARTQPAASPPADLYVSTADEVIITCTGGLTMTPEPADKAPKSPEESILQLRGSPATLFSYADQARVSCDLLQYQSQAQVLDLTGSPAQPLRVSTPDFLAEGQHFTFDRRRNEGGFTDSGWLESVRGGAALLGPAAEQSTTLDDSRNPPLRIAWNRRVDLRFHAQAAGNETVSSKPQDKLRIEFANFLGDVKVTSDDFVLQSDSLAVTFSDRPGRQQAANRIVAADGVQVRSTRDKASLGCDMLVIELTQSRDDRTIPAMMTATGNVEALDESQIMWADTLIAKFREIDPNQPAEAGDDAARRRMARNGIEVVSVLAERNIQIRMNDGTRAFADQMQGDPVAGTVILTADNELLIVSQTMVIDQGKRLELNREQQTALWPGAGRARMFKHEVLADSSTRVDRPAIDESANPIEVRALWTDSMNFNNQANNGGGALEITGNVDAVSQPSSLEYNTMKGQSLRLEFARTDGDVTIEANPVSATSNSPQDMMQGRRQLNMMTTRGGAKLESRTWLKEDHSDVPRVFYIAGETIWYNNLTLEAGVPSPGELLVRDERLQPAQNAAVPPQNGQTPLASFNASGTTAFKWAGELRMSRIADNRYRIDLNKDVEIRHRDLNQQGTIVTGQAIQATVDRTDANREKSGALDLGGSMELISLHADGGVYIKTPQRDVLTDTLDYDMLTQMAQLSAVGNRTVSVTTTGNPNVIKAQSMSWDMAKDIITIIRGSGTTNR